MRTSKTSSTASPMTSLVISMRSFCTSNSRMIFCSAGRFIWRFMAPIARVAPFIASLIACVLFSVCGRQHDRFTRHAQQPSLIAVETNFFTYLTCRITHEGVRHATAPCSSFMSISRYNGLFSTCIARNEATAV